MRRRSIAVVIVSCGLLLLAGCGDVTHQTRFIPTSEEIGWGSELVQLPWQPPALDYHQPRPKLDPDDQSFIVHEYPDSIFGMRFEHQAHE